MTLAVCRFCHESCAPHEITHAPEDYAVRYGPRHSAHVSCAVQAQGPDWIRRLKTWQLNTLSLRLVNKLRLAPVMEDEMNRRQPR